MDTLELSDLELVILEDDIPCESRHQYVKVCSHEVMYRVSDCRREWLVCRNTVEDPVNGTRARMGDYTSICRQCKRYPAECWDIRPV